MITEIWADTPLAGFVAQVDKSPELALAYKIAQVESLIEQEFGTTFEGESIPAEVSAFAWIALDAIVTGIDMEAKTKRARELVAAYRARRSVN